MINKDRVLKTLLIIGGIYYIIGAVVHFFGLTLFPFYDGNLYSQYHDTVIALVAILLSIMLFTVARNPKRNIDTLNAFIIGGIIAIIFSVGIVWKIDFTELSAPAKKMQTIFEGMLLVIYLSMIVYLKPKK